MYGEAKPPSVGNELLYGLINTIVSIPAMISFAAIIFQVRLPPHLTPSPCPRALPPL